MVRCRAGRSRGAAGQQVQPVGQPRQQRRRREGSDPRGGQLDRQRQPVEPADRSSATDGAFSWSARTSDRPRAPAGRRARSRPARMSSLRVETPGRIGQRQRRHRVDVLARQPQHDAAGGEDRQARARGQQLDKPRRGAEQVLEVVQHQQQFPLAEERHARRSTRRPLAFPHPERLGDRRQDECGVGQGARPTKTAPSGKSPAAAAAAARASRVLPTPPAPVRVRSRMSVAQEHVAHGGDFALPADQRRERARESGRDSSSPVGERISRRAGSGRVRVAGGAERRRAR